MSALAGDLRQSLPPLPSFEVELGEVEIFPVTNVLYLSLKRGRREIENMHGRLARNLFAYREPFPFHPHVTLAQEIPEESVPEIYARAGSRWSQWARGRTFVVDSLMFVRNVNMQGWENLSEYALANGAKVVRTA